MGFVCLGVLSGPGAGEAQKASFDFNPADLEGPDSKVGDLAAIKLLQVIARNDPTAAASEATRLATLRQPRLRQGVRQRRQWPLRAFSSPGPA